MSATGRSQNQDLAEFLFLEGALRRLPSVRLHLLRGDSSDTTGQSGSMLECPGREN